MAHRTRCCIFTILKFLFRDARVPYCNTMQHVRRHATHETLSVADMNTPRRGVDILCLGGSRLASVCSTAHSSHST